LIQISTGIDGLPEYWPGLALLSMPTKSIAALRSARIEVLISKLPTEP